VNITESLLATLRTDAPVRQVLVGALWTGVVLGTEPPRCGLASTLQSGHDSHQARPPVREAGRLPLHSGRQLARLLRSTSHLEASIGMAALNALLEIDVARCVEINAEDVIRRRGAGRRVAIIGHFPFVERVRRVAAECHVLELHPRSGDLPADRATDVLPQVDVVAITGTSLINHTFERLIQLCQPDSFVLVLGASAPLSPAILQAGADVVCGTVVTDPELVMQSVAQGATFRQIKRAGGLRLLTLSDVIEEKHG
jgi:uncharacterized protein (DUF4213/DUF364 family)